MAVTAWRAGETRDTVEMGYVTALLANAHFTRAERTRLFRSWGGGIGMLPVGGRAVWGNATSAPDDPPRLRERGLSFGCASTLSADSNQMVLPAWTLSLLP